MSHLPRLSILPIRSFPPTYLNFSANRYLPTRFNGRFLPCLTYLNALSSRVEHELGDFFQTSSLQLTFYLTLLCSAVSRMQISASHSSCSSLSSTLGSALGLMIDVIPEPDFT